MPSFQPAMLPRAPLYRVGWPPDPFMPPDWHYARRDGTFGGRYDDPRAGQGVPPHQRYRVLYLASQPASAYGETVAQFRPSVKTLSQYGGRLPFGVQPSVPRDWRINRRLGSAVLFLTLPVVDLDAADTVQALRPALAPMAARLQLPDIDLNTITGPQRDLTQEAALHIYMQHDAQGQPLYAGMRYVSRLKRDWECWAIFADRMHYRPLRIDPIAADDPHLYDAARILGLTIEDDRGGLIVPV
jgi:RES domain